MRIIDHRGGSIVLQCGPFWRLDGQGSLNFDQNCETAAAPKLRQNALAARRSTRVPTSAPIALIYLTELAAHHRTARRGHWAWSGSAARRQPSPVLRIAGGKDSQCLDRRLYFGRLGAASVNDARASMMAAITTQASATLNDGQGLKGG